MTPEQERFFAGMVLSGRWALSKIAEEDEVGAEARTLAYIAATARDIAERLRRDSEQGLDLDTVSLIDDVAWLARQVAVLAEIICYPEPK